MSELAARRAESQVGLCTLTAVGAGACPARSP